MNTQRKEKHPRTAVRRQKSKQGEESSVLISIIKSSLLSLVITFVISFVLLLLGTAVAYTNPDPAALVTPVSLVSLYLSAFFGGFVCRKLNKQSAPIAVMLTSALFVLLGLVISLCLPSSPVDPGVNSWLSLVLRLAVIGMFFVGSALAKGSNKSKKKHKRNKK